MISAAAVSGASEPWTEFSLDVQSEILADRALVGVRGIGRTHHFAIAGDGAFALENLHHDRARAHVLAQIVEEGAFTMHRVEPLGLFAAEANPLLATTRRPAASKRATMVPVMLRLVASGLMMDSVLSTAMTENSFPDVVLTSDSRWFFSASDSDSGRFRSRGLIVPSPAEARAMCPQTDAYPPKALARTLSTIGSGTE